MNLNQPVRAAMMAIQHPKPVRQADQSEGPATGSGTRVLVVEDDFLVGSMTESALLDAGYEVVGVAASGEEAVELGKDLRPVLVLMDIRLAGEMSGIEAAVQLRELGIPSLFATAHTDPGTHSAGDAARPLGWLAKPYTDTEVLAAVSDALARLGAQ